MFLRIRGKKMIFRMSCTCIFFTLSLLISTTLKSETSSVLSNDSDRQQRLAKFNSWIDTIEHNNQLHGSLLYARNGEIIYERVVGLTHPSKPKKLTLESSFNLASVSKQFTSTAIMLLKIDKKLDYDQKVQSYLPEFPYESITIRHLLNHTSGLMDYGELAEKHWKGKIFDNREMLKLFKKHKPDLHFIPGDKFAYSNTGYVTLSAVIERVTGKSFANYLYMNIFSPLDMKNTRVVNLLSEKEVLPTRVYGQHNGKLHDLTYLDGVTGDGAVYSSARDLLRWHTALINYKLIPEVEQLSAFKPATLNDGSLSYYGFGWGLDKKNPHKVSHMGGWVGFRTSLTSDFKNNEVAIALTSDTGGVKFRELVKRLASAF
jgi:N-acyl-D-amino-acid deacylase